MNEKLLKQINFLIEIDKAKDIFRQSLVLNKREENDAEHSWHICMSAIILKEYFIYNDIDISKALKMILIHDLVEIYSGDTPTFSEYSAEEKFLSELSSAKKIFSLLPEEQNKEYLSLWEEFEEAKTKESLFANAFDKFQGFLQNISSDGHTWKKFSPNREKVLNRTKMIKEYLPEVYENIIYPTIEKYVEKGIIKP